MNYKKLKFACFTSSISTSVAGNFPPLLFITFRSLYGISYSLLGFLILINFCTQLAVDLIFSFFSHKFNISRAVKTMPLLSVIGLIIYAAAPIVFKGNIYIGLVIGTMFFAASSGFAEVLISPMIAAIPSKDPDRQMSGAHSVYAWGVVGIIVTSTLFLLCFGNENWQWLALLFAIIPLISFLSFLSTPIPEMETSKKVSGVLKSLKNPVLLLCIAAIFFGGAAECTMAQWASGYAEQALALPKVWGDLFGAALFALMLGLGRTLYSKIGKNIEKVLLLGAVGAAVCYFVAAVSPIAVIGLTACAVTGFCASMLWPGSLIVVSEHFPSGGVFIFAIMAAGGDLGASVAPQLVGIMTDSIIASESAANFALNLGITVEQLGMKLGMLVGMLFPLTAVIIYSIIIKKKKQSLK